MPFQGEGKKVGKHSDRAGKHKRYQRAAVLALTVLLIILLAGRVLPVCAGKNVPAGAFKTKAKPGRILALPLKRRRGVSQPLRLAEGSLYRGKSLPPGRGPCACGRHWCPALDGVVTAARRGAAYACIIRRPPEGRAGNALSPHAVSLCPGRGGGYSGPAAGHCRTDGPCHRGTPAL